MLVRSRKPPKRTGHPSRDCAARDSSNAETRGGYVVRLRRPPTTTDGCS